MTNMPIQLGSNARRRKGRPLSVAASRWHARTAVSVTAGTSAAAGVVPSSFRQEVLFFDWGCEKVCNKPGHT
jgi:hypothetical protein